MPQWAPTEAFKIFAPRDARFLPARIKLRICVECNSTMARRYEDRVAPLVKPLMWGNNRHLTARQQAEVARWVVKTSLLLSIAHSIKSGRDPERTRQLLVNMIDVDVPPDGSSVRIGRFTAGEEPRDAKAQMAKLLPAGAPKLILGYGVSGLARVVFEHLIGDSQSIRTFIAGTKRSDRLIRIWPPQIEGVDFPPPQVFTEADMEGLRQAYRAAARGAHTRYTARTD